ncbi:hypothetical protein JCM10908_004659 [Rhodotorula pacifica]|uniref:uncharacterized protein n=1 Tax=Rhodotorula pacifica TaxID=1495444 RepID=UPI00317F4A85
MAHQVHLYTLIQACLSSEHVPRSPHADAATPHPYSRTDRKQPPPPGPQGFTWEGDTTLHSYCYDYLRKRGWAEAASTFAKEAGIDERAWTGPPIEAPQGLLYEWWSVFWDVFIARSQKMGPRNPNADAYVEAMRAKRDPLVVQFAGPHQALPMNLPRSLAHPARPAYPPPPPSSNNGGAAGGPPRAAYGQMHVLEQQELQNQMQQQRGRVVQQQQQQQHGPGGGGGPPQAGPSSQPQQRMVSNQQPPPQGYPSHSMAPPQQQQQGHYALSGGGGGGPPGHHGDSGPAGGLPPHALGVGGHYEQSGPLPPGSQAPPPSMPMSSQPQQQQQHIGHPSASSSAAAMNGAGVQGSPHFGNAMPPGPPGAMSQQQQQHQQQQQQQAYANGRPGRPPSQQREQQSLGGPGGAAAVGASGAAVVPAFQAAMSAIGLGTRDPDLLAPEEYTAVVAQMRRMGTLPPTAQTAQMRIQQQQQQQQQQLQQQTRQAAGPPPPGGPGARVPIPQRQMSSQPYQQMQQQQQQAQQRGGMPPPQYNNASSPASPAYSAPSPYTTPHLSHMQISPSGNSNNDMPSLPQPPLGVQGSPASAQGFTVPLPPPSRGAGGGPRSRVGGSGPTSQKGSPAAVSISLAKRTGPGMDEPSPRTRKRQRAGTREESNNEPPETPGAQDASMSGGASPAASLLNGPAGGLPPPPPQPNSQQAGPLFLPEGNGPPGIPYRASPSPSLGPPPQSGYQAARSPLGGDGINGGGGNRVPNGGLPPGQQNGHHSRPSSAASNHQYASQQQQQLGLGLPPNAQQQGLSPSQQPQLQQAQGGQYVSPTEGTPRPFAGSAPPPGASSTSSTPRQPTVQLGPGDPPPSAGAPLLANGLSVPPPSSSHQNAAKGQLDAASQIDVTDDDVFAGLDFDSFLNENMFAEDGPTS